MSVCSVHINSVSCCSSWVFFHVFSTKVKFLGLFYLLNKLSRDQSLVCCKDCKAPSVRQRHGPALTDDVRAQNEMNKRASRIPACTHAVSLAGGYQQFLLLDPFSNSITGSKTALKTNVFLSAVRSPALITPTASVQLWPTSFYFFACCDSH